LQSIIDKCRICGTEGEAIEHMISSCIVLAQSEYKKRHDICAKIIHMNLAVKFNLLKDTQPHYSYKPESCLENDNYKLYFDRTVLTDIHIQHNRPDIIILNKQEKQAYLLDIAVPNSHNITHTYNTKINKYLRLSVAMRNLRCLEKISILPLIIFSFIFIPPVNTVFLYHLQILQKMKKSRYGVKTSILEELKSFQLELKKRRRMLFEVTVIGNVEPPVSRTLMTGEGRASSEARRLFRPERNGDYFNPSQNYEIESQISILCP
jgi:hypothetical protein